MKRPNWILRIANKLKKQTPEDTKKNLDIILGLEKVAGWTDWLYLDSSNMYAFRYDDDIQKMEVQFRDRGGNPASIYEYENVPLEIAHALNDALSHGSYFYYNIRMEYPYTRLV